ncbi:MAG TPA: MBL fold metallo-hydrolase [Gemmataceae bacterium]|nr:MBL fold metallo-hydrolase [Gemmataceae bacterium]
MMATPHIRTLVSMPFEENTYVVWLAGSTDCVVIDPGLEPDLIVDCLREEGLTVRAILNTHGHSDHIAGNERMKQLAPDAPLIIGAGDARMLTDAEANLSAPFGFSIISPLADRTVKEGDVVEVAGLTFTVFDIPGHSPGHVVFVREGTPTQVFGGDVLFRGSIGRYDFPGGNGPLLLDGIRRKLFTLPADTVVYPGHGPVTTIENEMQTNPFLSGE